MTKRNVPVYNGTLRNHSIRLPHCIRECSGIRIFGMRIKSIAFTTDVAIIKNINADAIIAVYPFTPQPAISQAVIGISDVPVFVGVGGGITGGDRSVRLAIEAENQGAFGVVVNAPISNEVISRIKEVVDIPVIATIVSDQMDIRSRIEAGADFLNVSGAAATPQIVRRKHYPVRPMSLEDAAMQMELLGHSFFVFIDIDTDRANVLYRRKDGTLGLLEPEA